MCIRDGRRAVLGRLARATDALGGVFWMVAGRNEKDIAFRAGAALELESAAGEEGGEQREQVLRAASEVILSGQPLVLMPAPPGSEAATPGVLVNLGPHAIVAAALRSGDDALGALQLWFPARGDPKKLAELALMLQALMQDLGPRLRSRHLRDLGAQSHRQQRLLQLATDLAGRSEAEPAGRLAAAHAREILGVNRVTLFVRRGGVWRVLAVSGQEAPDERSRLLKSMTGFVAATFQGRTRVVSGGGTGVPPVSSEPGILPGSPNIPHDTANTANPDALDPHMRSAALIPLRAPDGPVFGCLLAESVEPDVFGPPGEPGDPRAPLLVLAEWLADFAARGLHSALVRQAVPLGGPLFKLARWRVDGAQPQARRRWIKAALLLSALLAAALWPVQVRVDGDCVLLPLQRAFVTAEAPGRVEAVLARSGQHVSAGQVLARLDTQRLQAELEAARQTRRRLEAEAARQRGQGKEALARIAALEAQAQGENEKRLELEIALAELRSPLDGVVMTPDVHLKTGGFLQAGETLAEVASVDAWDLRLTLPEADLSLLEEALAAGPVPVRCLLYTQSAREFQAVITEPGQISPVLEPGAEGGVFTVTLPRVEAPPELVPLLRPGLTGRVRISLHERPAGVVFLRGFTRWLRMRWWL